MPGSAAERKKMREGKPFDLKKLLGPELVREAEGFAEESVRRIEDTRDRMAMSYGQPVAYFSGMSRRMTRPVPKRN